MHGPSKRSNASTSITVRETKKRKEKKNNENIYFFRVYASKRVGAIIE